MADGGKTTMGQTEIAREIEELVARRDFITAFDLIAQAQASGLSPEEALRLLRYVEGSLADVQDYDHQLANSDDDLIG